MMVGVREAHFALLKGIRKYHEKESTKEKDMNKFLKMKLIILFIFIFCFAGCARDTEESETEPNTTERSTTDTEEKTEEDTGEAAEEESKEIQTERQEISIAFPFYGDREDKLTLAVPENGQDAYELVHYDRDGEIIQRIPCGKLTEPVSFSFDGLVSGNDLEIFSEGSDTGLLYIWKDQLFSTTPIEIPRYEEVRSTAMLTLSENEKFCEKQIYIINEDKNRTEKARSFQLQKDTATLTIRDELENMNLFEGAVHLDENGNLLNEEYFEMLLWDDISRLYNYEEENIIYTWIGEEPEPREEGEEIKIDSFDSMQNYWFGNAGHTQEYESRQTFLAEFGFENSEPMFQSFDRYGNVQLELYADEDMDEVCGITYYTHKFNTELEEVTSIRNAFSICSITETEWNGQDPFLLKSVYGTSAEDDSYVVDYEESTEYTDSGKPDLFVGRGRLTDREVEEDMLKIDFIYREDGTLFYRDYSHHDLVFGSTLCSLYSFYDEHERVIFERGYITHGWLEYYYIYEERDGKITDKPTYILVIDYNLNYAIPNIIKCQ